MREIGEAMMIIPIALFAISFFGAMVWCLIESVRDRHWIAAGVMACGILFYIGGAILAADSLLSK